jgi:hypothetical protein
MKYKMNKNVVHNGVILDKGQECPENLAKEMLAQGHAEECKKEAPAPEKAKGK